MMIGQIKSGNASREFDGYANKQATNSKIMYNVFQNGDKWFLSGMFMHNRANLVMRFKVIKKKNLQILIIQVTQVFFLYRQSLVIFTNYFY